MNALLADQIKALIAVHGNAFFEELERIGQCPFGFCECGRPGRPFNIGSLHFAACDLCRKVWGLGCDLFPWKHEPGELWEANAKWLAYQVITPRWTFNLLKQGSLPTNDDIQEFFAGVVNYRLNDSAQRKAIIDRVAELEISNVKG